MSIGGPHGVLPSHGPRTDATARQSRLGALLGQRQFGPFCSLASMTGGIG